MFIALLRLLIRWRGYMFWEIVLWLRVLSNRKRHPILRGLCASEHSNADELVQAPVIIVMFY